jgi:hypothetical protein
VARRDQLFKQATINQTKQFLSIKLSELDEKLRIQGGAINVSSLDLTAAGTTADDMVVHDEPDGESSAGLNDYETLKGSTMKFRVRGKVSK